MASIRQALEETVATLKAAVAHEEQRLKDFFESVPARFHDITHEELAALSAWIGKLGLEKASVAPQVPAEPAPEPVAAASIPGPIMAMAVDQPQAPGE